jgi:hypothetical protein
MIVTTAVILDDYLVEVGDAWGNWMKVECDDPDCADWRISTKLQAPYAITFHPDVELEDDR